MVRTHCSRCRPGRVCRVPQRQVRGAFSLFSKLAERMPVEASATTLVVVTHALPDNALLVRFLSHHFGQVLIVPKPRSICRRSLGQMSRWGQVMACGRAALARPGGTASIERLVGRDRRLLIADMGGYFAPELTSLRTSLGGQFAGVVEDTANGHVRYAALAPEAPVISLARSAIKLPEDVVVGRTIARALVETLSCYGLIAARMTYLVLGFGRVGRSAAEHLLRQGREVLVYDPDPLRQIEARAAGFSLPPKETALREATAIICASGNRSLAMEDLAKLRDGCVIASATSPDDEFDFNDRGDCWQRFAGPFNTLIMRSASGREVVFVNRCQAANFQYGAVVGAPIHLVHGAMIASLSRLAKGEAPASLSDLALGDQQEIASLWSECFPEERSVHSFLSGNGNGAYQRSLRHD